MPFVGIAAAYLCETWFELVDGYVQRRPFRFSGGWRNAVNFLLSAHITGVAVSMLLYSNARLMPIAFAAAVAIASKALFRVKVNDSSRHFLNPSNFGITVALLLFPWVGIAPPYHFSENLQGIGSWILPAVIVDLARERGVDEGWVQPLDGTEHAVVTRNWRGGSVRRLRRVVEAILRQRDLRATRN